MEGFAQLGRHSRGASGFAQAIAEVQVGSRLIVTVDTPLAPYTSLKVGGTARFMVRAHSSDEIIAIASVAADYDMPVLVLGGGSNVVVADAGFDGIVIKIDAPTGTRHAGTISSTDGDAVLVEVEAGCQTAGFARWAARQGLAGFEWACGIPGTVGGAVAGNAGAYSGEMASIVAEVRAWVPSAGAQVLDAAPQAHGGAVIRVPASEMAFGYRTSRFKRGPGVVLSTRLRLRHDDPATLLARIEGFEAARRQKQPTERSCGSVFRNPPGEIAGRLLEQAGMKGRSRGDAQVSAVHANWIINRGAATATDVLSLIREGRTAVHNRTGIALQIEVLLVGDWDPHAVAELRDGATHPAQGPALNTDLTLEASRMQSASDASIAEGLGSALAASDHIASTASQANRDRGPNDDTTEVAR